MQQQNLLIIILLNLNNYNLISKSSLFILIDNITFINHQFNLNTYLNFIKVCQFQSYYFIIIFAPFFTIIILRKSIHSFFLITSKIITTITIVYILTINFLYYFLVKIYYQMYQNFNIDLKNRFHFINNYSLLI